MLSGDTEGLLEIKNFVLFLRDDLLKHGYNHLLIIGFTDNVLTEVVKLVSQFLIKFLELLREHFDSALELLLHNSTLLSDKLLLNFEFLNLTLGPQTLLLESVHELPHGVHLNYQLLFLLGQVINALLVKPE